jgi:hypothetical protein
MERDPGGGGINVAALRLRIAAVLARRVVQIEPQPPLDALFVDGVRLLVDDDRRGHAGHGAVAPHVASERLPDGELEATDGAAVELGLGEREVAAFPVQPRLLVAGAVPAQRLERRERAVARLADEHALRSAVTAPGDGQRLVLLLLAVRHKHQHTRHLALLNCEPLHFNASYTCQSISSLLNQSTKLSLRS